MAKVTSSNPAPQKMRATYESILALTDAFCRDHLDDDYRNLARRMAAKLMIPYIPADRN